MFCLFFFHDLTLGESHEPGSREMKGLTGGNTGSIFHFVFPLFYSIWGSQNTRWWAKAARKVSSPLLCIPQILVKTIGACTMTTKFLDNKICTFKILLSWRFPRKTQRFWTIFISAPKCHPLKNATLYFYCRLAVSELETNLASRWEGVRLPRASGKSPDFPGSSPNFPGSFSATSPEVLSLWNLTAIHGFTGSSPDFPGSSPDFPGGFPDFPGGQPQKLSLSETRTWEHASREKAWEKKKKRQMDPTLPMYQGGERVVVLP